jgi:hypothetical protein
VDHERNQHRQTGGEIEWDEQAEGGERGADAGPSVSPTPIAALTSATPAVRSV